MLFSFPQKTLVILSAMLLTCSNEVVYHPDFPYSINEPDATFELPGELREISGLSLCDDGEHLVAHNDEEGTIFVLSKQDGKVERKIDFWDEGDYEGIEVVGDDAFVIKSNGNIYQVKNFLKDEHPQTIKHSSFLNKENDVEGLGYDPARNALLVGCKGKGFHDDGSKMKKAIYAFSLDRMEMESQPVYVLSLEDIQHLLEHYPEGKAHKKICETFAPGTNEMRFNPSAIAVHPLNGNVYLTSSTGKMLMVMDHEGHLLFIEKFEKSVHPQPEGLCFDKDGTLYIANEGKDGKGRIYRFAYRN
jgi:uncharacterized protein YjiK